MTLYRSRLVVDVRGIRKRPILGMLVVACFAFAVTNGSFLILRAEQVARPSQSVWSAVYTESQAKRDEAVYERQCAQCHGLTLGGADVPPLIGEMFMSNWEGLTLSDLFERLRVTMPGDNPGTLSSQHNSDVIAYILKVGGFPAGDQELATERELLKQILMLARKPTAPIH